MLINQKSIVRENSKKFQNRKCPQHKFSHFQKVCTHSNCVKSIALSLLCSQCYRKHSEYHNGLVQYFLEFDKIFSDSVFADIELLESEFFNFLLEKQQKVDVEVDRQCAVILEEVKRLLESIKSHIKLKYGSNNLVDTIIKLKESLKTEYNTLFSIDEASIKDDDIKQYLEFYLKFEKMLEQNQVKCEEIYEGIENKLSGISQLFNKKLKDIKLVLQSDGIK